MPPPDAPLDPQDVRIDVWRHGDGSGFSVRVTHTPTGAVAQATADAITEARRLALGRLADGDTG